MQINRLPSLTCEQARKRLDYNPETGVFRWRAGPNAGKLAGRVNGRGYHQLIVDYHYYQAHRVAWLYVYGEWPADEIDHINRVKTDNRIVNLRVVSRRENSLNIGARNRFGVPGVYRLPSGRYQLKFCGQHVGYFLTLDAARDARSARVKALQEC